MAAATAALDPVPAVAGHVHLAHFVLAPRALERGVPETAGWMLDAAAWVRERSLPNLDRACLSLARRAGAVLPRRGRGDSDVPPDLATLGVTSREYDVLALLAGGRTNAEIAERLFLFPKTVKTHVERLLAKTGAPNRTVLAQRFEA